MKFYVYLLRDPRPGKGLQPIYVGKGKGGRARSHWFRAEEHPNPVLRGVFNKIRQADLVPQLETVGHFDVEADAFQLEIELIAKYGRRDLKTGILCNLTDGGEGTSGCLVNAERMKALNLDPQFSKARDERMRKRHADPVFAKAHAARLCELRTHPEFAKLRNEGMRKLHADPEFVKARDERASKVMRKLNANLEFAKKNAERARKLHADPEHAKAHAARSSEMMRKLHTNPEFAKARVEGMRKQWADPEFRARASAAIIAALAKRRAAKAAQASLQYTGAGP